MSAPTPAPRTLLNETKKPIPAPRSSRVMAPGKTDNADATNANNEGKNTFSRRVRTLSNASRQIAGDIGDKVQEGRKVVMETTRQSVRKITKRFTSNFIEAEETPNQKQDYEDTSSDIDMFSSISFNSPFKNNIYSNVEESISVMDEDDQPPPPYPPPPLRDEIYDKPNSVVSSNSTSSDGSPLQAADGPPRYQRHPYDYESVFPPYPYNSDSESCVDMTAGTIDRSVDIVRSKSFNFYDALPLPKPENVFLNIDNTPVMQSIQSEGASSSSDRVSYARSNSLYENHIIPKQPPTRPSKSVIMEFDPLIDLQKHREIDELNELEKNLQGDLYGNINVNVDNLTILDDISECDDTYISPPPPPPTRFDSLEAPIQPQVKEKNVSVPKPSTDNKASAPYRWLKHVNEVLKKAPEFVKQVKSKDNFVQRPALMPRGIIQQKGMLFKVTRGVEDFFGEFIARWCVLQGNHLMFYLDNTADNAKEVFTMETILSVQILQDQKFKYKCENDDLHCFEINIAGKSRGGFVFGTKSISERRVWLQKLAESLTCKFSAKITNDYKRIGWGYIKEGLSGQWVGAWLVLSRRKLFYAIDECPVKSLDLRKARCFTLEPAQDSQNYPGTTDKGPNIVIHFTSGTFYFRMWTQRETKVWCHIIKLSAQNNGARLDQQQLTKNDVPVVVEKCINFVYAYGSMTEGIYRRAGSNTVVSDLLTQFRNDAWSVQLTDKYTNHDVANALKRFFRDLSEPLIDNNKRQYLYQVSLVKSKEERVRMFKGIFDQVPPIILNTTRLLLGHLYFISSQSGKNLMNTENLSAVWGPTLLHHEGEEDCNKDHAIVQQLIDLHKDIFPEDDKEAEQERKMLQILKKCSSSPQGVVNTKSSGDFRVWIYLYNKEGRTFNILIGPQRTAYEVLCELSPKINIPVQELILEELVLNNNLNRPIHHTEKVLDVVLRWSYWDENDCKDNCLIINNISKYWEYLKTSSLPLSAELKFADSKTKNLKTFYFDFLQAKLSYYKDKSCSNLVASWNIEDIIWYFGHESKRNPPTKYTLTFIEKSMHPKRTKSSPWFGNVICWNEPTLRAIWLTTMWSGEHPKDLTPPPQHINLMSS